ncbi:MULTISPECIES: hypothetical protein [Cysteiniphilum]|uniref:hypothetical protein n=1 Tax=Cysteiniphilum TaxID=2056696 RepID=UPI0017806315|nr:MULTISPECIES: hypothetical protein [Cysteiniphilum]
MSNNEKELDFGRLHSGTSPKIIAIKAQYAELSNKRQVQVNNYLEYALSSLPVGISENTKVRLLANEVFNGNEQDFETRLQGLSEITSEDDAYQYMNNAYQQDERLEFDQSDEVKDKMNSESPASATNGIENYLRGNAADKNNDYD